MIDKLKKVLQIGPNLDKSAETPEHNLHLVCAALLIEVIHADHKVDPKEETQLIYLLQQKWKISDEDLDTLILQAKTMKDNATSLYQFTHVVNEQMSEDEKFTLIKAMWSIAFADQQLHRYEEHLIRQVAELIHLPHVRFMRAKHDAKQDLDN